jgi:hypothetical protein
MVVFPSRSGICASAKMRSHTGVSDANRVASPFQGGQRCFLQFFIAIRGDIAYENNIFARCPGKGLGRALAQTQNHVKVFSFALVFCHANDL